MFAWIGSEDMLISYETSEVAPKRRFEYWKEVVCHHCTTADSHPTESMDFSGSVKVQSLGMIEICTLNAPEHHWNRTERHLRTMPDEVVYLTYTEVAKGSVEQGDRPATMAPGHLMFMIPPRRSA